MIQSGSDKAAIAWAIAKNNEQSDSFEKQKKVYKDGIVDGKNPDDDITEEFQGEVPPDGIQLIIDPDNNAEENCNVSGNFITNMKKGFFVKQTPYDDPTANFCHIYYYPYVFENSLEKDVGTLYFDEYDHNGNLLQEYHRDGCYDPGNWTFVKEYPYAQQLSYKATNLILSPTLGLYSNTILTQSGDPYSTLWWSGGSHWINSYLYGARYISTTPFASIDIN